MVVVMMLAAMLNIQPNVVPKDPLQRIAYRAVILSEWGCIPEWKSDIYKSVLQKEIKINGYAKRTTYCRSCAGRTCADGTPVQDGVCAASPNIRMHSIIWLESDGLKRVHDRGGAVKLGKYVRSGETANFDIWKEKCVGGCWTGPGTYRRVPYAVLSVGEDWPPKRHKTHRKVGQRATLPCRAGTQRKLGG